MRSRLDEEKEYLEKYDIADFERPSLAVDIVLFSILKDREAKNVRKLPESELKVLLIKRGQHPFKERWALPGGFCRPYEDVKASAARELFEETGVSGAYMSLIGAYGKPGRDPRGWIISNTYLALADGEKCVPRAGTDAWESAWFTVKLQTQEHVPGEEGNAPLRKTHTLLLTNSAGAQLKGVIQEESTPKLTSDTVDFQIKNSDLAFDHALIILNALLKLRSEAENSRSIIFNIMPQTFTMAQLKDAFQLILDKPLIRTNFNRDMTKYVEETGSVTVDVGHRPAKIYRRKIS